MTPCELFVLSGETFLAPPSSSLAAIPTVLRNMSNIVRSSSERLVEERVQQHAVRTEMELRRYRAVAQMVAGVAHEVNTPLGLVTTAASAEDVLTDLREAANSIDRNGQRASTLIQDFRRLSVGQIADTLEPLATVEVLHEIVALFSIEARQGSS